MALDIFYETKKYSEHVNTEREYKLCEMEKIYARFIKYLSM